MKKKKLNTVIKETTYDYLLRRAEQLRLPYKSRGSAIDNLVENHLESESDGLNGNPVGSSNSK